MAGNPYRRDMGYVLFRKELIRRFGKVRTDALFSAAFEKLKILRSRYPEIQSGERRHVEGIFLRAAMYQALLDEFPDSALILLEEGVVLSCRKVGTLLSAVSSFPGMAPLFMKMFAKMVTGMFGPSAGFRQEIYVMNSREIRFDITACPYCRWCETLGCPELVSLFCLSDEYCYGNLKKISFKRTGTLGTGADCCDFYLKRKGRS